MSLTRGTSLTNFLLKTCRTPGARCIPRPVATGRVSCVCDWLRDATGLDFGDRSWICNAALVAHCRPGDPQISGKIDVMEFENLLNLVLNPSKRVHTLRSVITVIQNLLREST